MVIHSYTDTEVFGLNQTLNEGHAHPLYEISAHLDGAIGFKYEEPNNRAHPQMYRYTQKDIDKIIGMDLDLIDYLSLGAGFAFYVEYPLDKLPLILGDHPLGRVSRVLKYRLQIGR